MDYGAMQSTPIYVNVQFKGVSGKPINLCHICKLLSSWKIQLKKVKLLWKMNERSEGVCLYRYAAGRISFCLSSNTFRLYLPVSMLQWWPSKVHVSVTMAMTWNWKENKAGWHKQTKKNQNKERGRKPNVQKHNATHIKINIEASDYFSAQLNSNAMNSNIIYK